MVTILYHDNHYAKLFGSQFTTLYGDQTKLFLQVSCLFPSDLVSIATVGFL